MYLKVRGDLLGSFEGQPQSWFHWNMCLFPFTTFSEHLLFSHFQFERCSLRKMNKLFIYKYFYEHQILQFQIIYFLERLGQKIYSYIFGPSQILAISCLDHIQIFDFSGILTVGVILFLYIIRMIDFWRLSQRKTSKHWTGIK